jgi:hypothetical protein
VPCHARFSFSDLRPILFELRNPLVVVVERRGRLDPAKSAQALRLIRALPITVDTNVDSDAPMRLARTHRLTVYDAAYLELAQRRGVALATLDVALSTAARAEALALIDPGARHEGTHERHSSERTMSRKG